MRTLLALMALTLSSGCARDDEAFPSLAPRSAEGRDFAEPAVTPPPPLTADPALNARLAALGGRLDTIVKGFDTDAARAATAAGTAGVRTVGSEAWISAQSALALLDDWRAQAGGLANEVDTATRERAEAVGTAYPPLDALRRRADTEAARESEIIATIGAKLPTPR